MRLAYLLTLLLISLQSAGAVQTQHPLSGWDSHQQNFLARRPEHFFQTGLRVDLAKDDAASLQVAVEASVVELLQLPFEDVQCSSALSVKTLTFKMRVHGASVKLDGAAAIARELATTLGPRIGAEEGRLLVSPSPVAAESEESQDALTLVVKAFIVSWEGEDWVVKMLESAASG